MAWVHLRHRCQQLSLDQALESIDQWWRATPWRPYYLHWDDRQEWPDPWQLLADNQYCDIARALGILYTVRMLDRDDCADARMIMAAQGNLVLVNAGKYIMNQARPDLLNIQSTPIEIERTLEPEVLQKLLGET